MDMLQWNLVIRNLSYLIRFLQVPSELIPWKKTTTLDKSNSKLDEALLASFLALFYFFILYLFLGMDRDPIYEEKSHYIL